MTPVKTSTKIFATLAAVIGLIGPLVGPYLSMFITTHPQIAAALAAASTVLALFHSPTPTA